MKKIIFILFLFATVTVSAQNIPENDTTSNPAITAIGKPDGAKSEMKIGKDGGSFTSADGKIKLIIPEGAISKKTTFSIQPVINLMPNGNGKAYRLEPSGIEFQKPVELVFHYDAEEPEDSMQLLMGIAMQDEKGQWYGLKNFTLDTVAKTISGNISHFSDWSRFDQLKLYPPDARLKVSKSIDLTIDVISGEDVELSPLGEPGGLSPLRRREIPWRSSWSATSGTVMRESKTTATYTAPASVPAKNPVAVSAKLNGLTYTYRGVVFKDLKLVSNILVYDDAYEVTIVSHVRGSAGSQFGMSSYKDAGSFVVSLESGVPRIIEKVNNNQVDEVGYRGKCIITLLKPGTGTIHIAGVRSIKLSPAISPQHNRWIEIVFINTPVRFSLIQFTCPPVGKGAWTTSNNSAANSMAAVGPAQPMNIKFEVKEEEQTIYQVGQEGDDIYVKISVKQLKED